MAQMGFGRLTINRVSGLSRISYQLSFSCLSYLNVALYSTGDKLSLSLHLS